MEPGAHQTGVWDRPKGPKIDPNLGVYFRVSGGPKTRSYPIVTFRLYDAKPEVPDLDRFWTHFGSENGSNLTPKSLFLDPFWGSYSRRWPSWPSQADGAARQGIRGATRPRFPYHGSGGGSGVQVGNRPALRVPNGVPNGPILGVWTPRFDPQRGQISVPGGPNTTLTHMHTSMYIA